MKSCGLGRSDTGRRAALYFTCLMERCPPWQWIASSASNFRAHIRTAVAWWCAHLDILVLGQAKYDDIRICQHHDFFDRCSLYEFMLEDSLFVLLTQDLFRWGRPWICISLMLDRHPVLRCTRGQYLHSRTTEDDHPKLVLGM